MSKTKVEDFYAGVEADSDTVPYREYWDGEPVLAASTYESALGGDIVSATDYLQGTQGLAAAAADKGVEHLKNERFAVTTEKVSETKLPHRTIDDLTDPYNSPLLDGFVQSPFVPEKVITEVLTDDDGNPVYVYED